MMVGREDDADDALLNAARNGYHDPEAAVYRRVAAYSERRAKDPKASAQLVKFLRKTVDAFPGNARYYASLGKALFETKDCEGAQPIFRDLAAKNPRDTEALNLMALTSWCLGDLAAAREWFTRSLAVDAGQPAVRAGLEELAKGAPAGAPRR